MALTGSVRCGETYALGGLPSGGCKLVIAAILDVVKAIELMGR